MATPRNIFIVEAKILDANGTMNNISGYPAFFDSKNYDNDIDKALKRAEGSMSEAWGAMCKRDDRMRQTVMIYSIDGGVLDSKTMGTTVVPDPQPEPEPEPEPEEL